MFNIFQKKVNLKNKKILTFVGSPRTGSTLVGQIINYHPNCFISNESRLVQRVVLKNEKLDKVLSDIYYDAKKHFEKALENDKKFGKTINHYQPKWKDMADLSNEPEFQKKEILYIGDKKAGGVSDTYKTSPDKTIDFFNSNLNIKQIQIIRNPMNAAKSLMKSHGIKTFEEACAIIIDKTIYAEKLINSTKNDALTIYYEDLLNNPKETILTLIGFLSLEIDQEWLNKISQVVNTKDNTDFSDNEKTVFKNLLIEYNSSLFDRYKS